MISKLSFIVLFCFFLRVSASSAHAQNLMTDNPNSGVVVRDENGVKYLTTSVIADPMSTVGASDTATSTTKTTSQRQFFQVPEGFFNDFNDIFNKLIRVVIAASALLTFIYLIWGSFQWITSGGDKGKTEKARNSMVAAVVGLIIVASSYAILIIVLNFLGYDNLRDILDDTDIFSSSGQSITM